VHEINPAQLGPVRAGGRVAWDTSPDPRPDEVIENAVVAGYHHTHAPTAVHLLDRGTTHIVIEKPIATRIEQLEALTEAMARHPEARVHVAFQRRYSPFNDLLLTDLDGPPVSMAATVYEVPLPARHWYRWPIVGNAVVSNGCHWIDHFLFLNGYAQISRSEATPLASQTVLNLELENGASCSISLRHEGAPMRGVRDLCVFWKADASVVIEDMRRYVAERGFRRIRQRTTHPYSSLEAMYDEFGRRMALDLPGDDVASIRASALATLDLAQRVDAGR
jgi:predicted dehydrogenase